MSEILNLSQMLAMARYKLAEPDSAASTWSGATGDAFIKQMINQACAEFNTSFPWPWMEAEQDISTVQTTISSSSTGTTLNVTSASGWGLGDYGWVFEGSNYERFKVNDVAAGILTIEAGVSNTYTTAAKVVKESYALPDDFNYIFNVRDITSSEFLKPMNPHKYDYDTPVYSSNGKPTDYLIYGFDKAREPASGTYTTDLGTDTITIVDSSLKALSDDYYKNWLLINTTSTREDQSRISSYTASSKTIILKKPITNQTDGETYYLIRNLRLMYFQTLPDSTYKIRIKYYRFPSLLINDTDVPENPEMFSHAIVNGAVGYVMLQDANEQRGMFYIGLMEKDMKRAWGLYGNRRYGMDEVYQIQNTSTSDYSKSADSD